MSYVCGKSSNKIIHYMDCRYIKMIPTKNRKYFYTMEDASESGYVQCKYCSYIGKYINKEKKMLEHYCIPNGIHYYFNAADGSLDVISHSGKWKIIVNGQRHFIWLYHKNKFGNRPNELIPGYHSQSVRRTSLMGYMKYIVDHDRYRDDNPLYERQRHVNTIKGSKKWKKDQKRAERMRRKQSINYVINMLEEIAAGRIA